MNNESDFSIRFANIHDVPAILRFIQELAEYEKLAHEVVATETRLKETLFGDHPAAEVILALEQQEPVGFALFFLNYSTFLAQPGIFLEDLFIQPTHRGKGYGEALLRYLAALAVERKCGRVEWSVLNWNQPAISFYRKMGAFPMDEWTTFRVSGEALAKLAGSITTDQP
ncbi:MAG TPA: GNAT family N-acetyltransferase [Rhodothermales bacterium]|nr:N-acetyltransferase [Bacteroidota bacterium]HRK74346.1 GNAT family N-acetyltransferase [Rhodothermales bacterium]HRR09379.1 GNAT family N-acetyltransferase [Rhodothermales bacterium]